jgi:hypothetical protein
MSHRNRLHRLPSRQDSTACTEMRTEKGWYHPLLSF